MGALLRQLISTVFATALFLVAGLMMSAAVRAEDASIEDRGALGIDDPFAATLWRIDVDASGRHIVSSASNNSLTLWSPGEPERADILRVPLRDEERQRARAVAISPDGALIAYGVPPLRDAEGLPRHATARIYLLARNGGAIVHTIEDVETRPQALRFSPSGDALAAGLSDGCGLRVWKVADWSLMMADDAGYGGDTDSLNESCRTATPRDRDRLPDTPGLQFADMATAGLWLVTSGDTGLRGYRRDGDVIALHVHRQPADIGLGRPEGVALSPDGTRLAVGDRRIRATGAPIELKVAILDTATLSPAQPPLAVSENELLSPAFLDPAEVPGADQMALHRVAWVAADGDQWIYAGGTLWCQIVEPDLLLSAPDNPGLDICAVRWRVPSGTAETEDIAGEDTQIEDIGFIPVGADRVMDFAPIPGLAALAYATHRRVGALDMDGQPFVTEDDSEFFHRARGADLRDRRTGGDGDSLDFAISDDGKTVYFEDYRDDEHAPIRLTFTLNGLTLEKADHRPAELRPPDVDELRLAPWTSWWNRRTMPVVNDLKLKLREEPNDVTRAVALVGRDHALVGSANFIRLIDYSGDSARVTCQRRVSAEAFRVNVTPDGSLAVVGHSDATLRWYRVVEPESPEQCRFEHLLSVLIRETDWGSDEWTWTAWVPGTGQFASDVRAKRLLTWQVTRPSDGQIATVPHSAMLDLYDRTAVSQALLVTGASDNKAGELQNRVARTAEAASLIVDAPGDQASVTTANLPFVLKLKGETGWPKNLTVELGSGERVAKSFDDRPFTPDEPITLTGAGDVRLDVTLPSSVQRSWSNFHVCFMIDEVRTCRTLNWSGALEAPGKRRLWATIVGFSGYEDRGLELRFAQNDALDLARLFVEDYRARVVDRTSSVVPDFDEIRIDLIVSATTDTARSELAELAKLPFVHVHEPTVGSVLAALEHVAAQDRNEELADDLVLFYYSGHGLVHPYNTDKGRTALLGPDIEASLSHATMQRSALSSDALLQALQQISAEKLVILDACRTTTGIPSEIPFDPALVKREFENEVLSAHFLFSAKAGQFSLEQKRFVFSSRRPAAHSGNGLFTYGLLRALTDPEADLEGESSGRNKIEVVEIDRFLRRFFDPDNAQQSAGALIEQLLENGLAQTSQQPTLVPARRLHSDISVVRSLEPDQKQAVD